VELNNKLYEQEVLQEAKNLYTNEKYKNKVCFNQDFTTAESSYL
jgi:hypothetical protein